MKLPQKEKTAALANLKKEGIFAFNKQQVGEDVPEYQRERRTKCDGTLIICGICQGFYSKKFYKRHNSRRQGDSASVACPVPLSLLAIDTQVDETECTQEILSKFRAVRLDVSPKQSHE